MATTATRVTPGNFVLDGREVRVVAGQTVLEAAREAGIYIPTLCYHPRLTPTGECGICLVELEGAAAPVKSCMTGVPEGAVVHTDSPRIREDRLAALKKILADHPHACLVCERRSRCKPFDICLRNVHVTERCVTCSKNTQCELQRVADFIGLQGETVEGYRYRGLPVLHDHPFFDRDYNLCIKCGRCVKVCRDVRGAGILELGPEGSKTPVKTVCGKSLLEAGCQSCGACVDVCPTGALMESSNEWEAGATRCVTTVCPYCGVGCKLEAEVKDGRIIRTRPADAVPNWGQACVKGRFGIVEFVHSGERLTQPLVRKGDEFVETSWDEALTLIAGKLSKHKGDEFALVASAKATNEDNYVMQKFTRAVMQTNNIDHCARL